MNLTLTQLNIRDFEYIKQYLSDIETTRYLPLERPYDEQEISKWFKDRLNHWQENEFGTFIIKESSTGLPIGYCGLEFAKKSKCVDIRYGISKKNWGKGYATRTAKQILKYGFNEINLSIIFGAAVHRNITSIHILKKLGMNPDKNFNLYGDIVSPYSITKNRFNNIIEEPLNQPDNGPLAVTEFIGI